MKMYDIVGERFQHHEFRLNDSIYKRSHLMLNVTYTHARVYTTASNYQIKHTLSSLLELSLNHPKIKKQGYPSGEQREAFRSNTSYILLLSFDIP